RVSEAVALPSIAGGEALLHGHAGWIGEAPILANAAMQPLRAAFGRLDGKGLQAVRFEILTGLLPFFRFPANPRACRHYEEGHMITPAVHRIEHVIAEAQAILPQLAAELEGVERAGGAGRE